jgi:DNA-binding transcriptional ArsR family regulator
MGPACVLRRRRPGPLSPAGEFGCSLPGATLNLMVKYSPEVLDAVFSALADPTRREIVTRLADDGEASVSQLAEPFDVSLPAVTKHIRVLERAGLVEHHKQGRVRRCRLVASPLRDADDWLRRYRRFWETRLDSLSDHLEEAT